METPNPKILETELLSDCIDHASYDTEYEELSLHFPSSDDTYTYMGVPRDVYEYLAETNHPGSFFVKNIRDVYDF